MVLFVHLNIVLELSFEHNWRQLDLTMVSTSILGIAFRPAAQGPALVFALLCFGTLFNSVQAKAVSNEQIQGKSN